MPSHWQDALAQQVRSALRDSGRAQAADTALLKRASAISGVRARADAPSGAGFWTFLDGWGPGFNADSTIAAVDVGYYCGTRCGHRGTVLLARRPGFAWRVWHTFTVEVF